MFTCISMMIDASAEQAAQVVRDTCAACSDGPLTEQQVEQRAADAATAMKARMDEVLESPEAQ